MAYMNQERKKQIEGNVKSILKKYGVKGSLRVWNHSTLVLTVRSGAVDFFGEYTGEPHWNDGRHQMGINVYHYEKHFREGAAVRFLDEVYNAMMDGNHDNSDIQSDYFDVGWYVDIQIGKWDKPYEKE